jgi:hypothetical protein
MLQPAATSTQSPLALSIGAQVGTAENSDIPEGFAALLALGLNISGDAEAAPNAALADIATTIRQIGAATGKLGGKILPGMLPDLEVKADEAAVAFAIQPAKTGETPEDPAPQADVAPQPVPTALALPIPPALPAHAVTDRPTVAQPRTRATQASPQTANLTHAGPAVSAQLPTSKAALATSTATVLHRGGALPVQNAPAQTTTAPQPATMAGQVTVSAQPLITQIAVAPSEVMAAPLVTGTPTEPRSAARPSLKSDRQPASQISIRLPSSNAVAQPALATATAIALQPNVVLPATSETLQPIKAEKTDKAEAKAIATNAPVRSEIAAQASVPVAPRPTLLTPSVVMPIAAATVVPLAAKPASSPDANAAPIARPAAAKSAEPAETAKPVAPANARAHANDFSAAIDTAKPIAAELQPALALRDAQPSPQVNTAAPSAPVAAQGGHDFAALVDRLVEARDAAMPQSIRAAIHHAEFGQVALNFNADDARLTVSMTSADPEFAPAVQAAAAMQANTQANSQSDNGSGSQRQDSQQNQQQSASASFASQSQTQAQGQAQSQGSPRGNERDRGDPQRHSNPTTGRADDDKKSGDRGGIYA